MAVIAKTSKFWKTMKQISVSQIGREAALPARLIVVGDAERRDQAVEELLGSQKTLPSAHEEPALRFFDSTDPATGFPHPLGPFDIVIDLGGGFAPDTAVAHYYNVDELGGWNRLVDRLLDVRPDLLLALGRRYPGLRKRVAERVIHDTSLANAEFAMLNALPGVIPIIAPLLPAAAISDIFLLTKNQAMMMYKLAAAHNLPLDIRARSRDLGPLLGNAFGWRAIARELVAVVPGGVGLAARGAIAYAGTAAVGKALNMLYQTGRPATKAQITKFYKEAYAGAKRIAAERLHVMRSQKRKEKAPVEEEKEKLETADRENNE